MDSDQNLQILRSIDKFDRVGPLGLFDLLTSGKTDDSGAFVPGCGLPTSQAAILVSFIGSAKYPKIANRFRLMEALESTNLSETETAWDRLLAMTPNEDETWDNGGRPKNIAWALDDLCKMLSDRPTPEQHK